MRTTTARIASAACLVGLPLGALACTCEVDDSPYIKQVEAAVRSSDVVAEVEIISTSVVIVSREVSGKRWSWSDKLYHEYVEFAEEPKLVAQVHVLRYWKGKHLGLIAVRTATQWQACGLGFEAGQRFLLYARSVESEEMMETDACTRTALVEKAEPEIQALDRLSGEQPSNNVFEATRETRAP